MAGLKAKVTAAGVATGVATTTTILQLVAATNHRVLLKGWSFTCKGNSATAVPGRVELVRQTDAGTMSAATPVKNNTEDGETLQTTAQHTATAEPTTTDVLRSINVHPQSGFAEIFPLGDEIVIPGDGRLGLRATFAATVDVDAALDFEE